MGFYFYFYVSSKGDGAQAVQGHKVTQTMARLKAPENGLLPFTKSRLV